MRLYLLSCLLLSLFSFTMHGQQAAGDVVLGEGATRITATTVSPGLLRIELYTGKVTLRYDEASGAYLAGLDKGVKLLKQGAPDLQRLSYAIQIPSGKQAEVNLLQSETKTYEGYLLAPSLGNISRDRKPGPRVQGAEYSHNENYPASTMALGPVYQVREQYGQALAIAPLQYNPVTRKLTVHTHMIIEVRFAEPGQKKSAASAEWESIFRNHFLNYGQEPASTQETRFAAIPASGRMLIVTPDKYLETLAPFIRWKNMLGIRTHILKTDTLTGGPSAANIQQYIKRQYIPFNLSYVVLVGDNTDIAPMHAANLAGPSDAAFGYVSGNDHYPDLMVGRLSANTNNELKVQLDRILAYEKTPVQNQPWYKYAAGVASNEGPGDNNEFDWEHMRNIRSKLMNATGAYTQVAELYDGSHGGADAAGDPNAGNLKDQLNAGTTIVNYCGHGSYDFLVTSGFSVGDVPQLTNDNGAWPLVWGVACVSGEFENQTCLGEQLLRQAHATSGKPTGAIAAFFSTINQYWDPPMLAQDAYVDLLTDGTDTRQKPIGSLTTTSVMAMNDAYASGGEDMTDTWVLFGDPSVKLHTKAPASLVVTHPATINRNATQLDLNINVAGAKAVLYYPDSILSVATAAGGSSTHAFQALTVLDTIWVTVSADDYKPYTGFIRVIDGVGVDETKQQQESVYLYPNPASTMLNIAQLKEDCHYSCYSATGVLIREGIVKPGHSAISLSALANGTYFLRLAGKQTTASLPFQVMR
ncbi:C25 family cysteine peptidase [Taibaiella koreensis]|uniref:C25 family cysteine peptidase n=1 Tax=Taibaiella koreensis TaxID=1268548 RepID=UPI0013C29F8D|nr:C25 family cysteine peptidase [Taibaiella koreensis]